MNKNQLTMAIIGGVALLLTLAVGYFIYDQTATREGMLGELNSAVGDYERNRDATRAQERALKENSQAVRDWIAAAYGEAAALTNAVRYGTAMLPPEFKAQMLADVRRYQSLPADSKTKVIAEGDTAVQQTLPDFKDYITGGRMPDRADLQRRWDDVCLFVDTLLECGAGDLMTLRVVTPPPPPPPQQKRGSAAVKAPPPDPFDVQTYEVVFHARPEALVAVLDAFAHAGRFISIDVFSFVQEPDPLLAMLNTDSEKKKDKESRRRRSSEEVNPLESDEARVRSGTVTDPADPLVCTPFKVSMTISTLKVRPAAEGKKEASK